MKNLNIAILSLVVTSLCASAAIADQSISTVTDYGDGIKISDYADASGFKAEGGGGVFKYDSTTKTITLTTSEVSLQKSFAAQNAVGNDAFQSPQVALNK